MLQGQFVNVSTREGRFDNYGLSLVSGYVAGCYDEGLLLTANSDGATLDQPMFVPWTEVVLVQINWADNVDEAAVATQRTFVAAPAQPMKPIRQIQ